MFKWKGYISGLFSGLFSMSLATLLLLSRSDASVAPPEKVNRNSVNSGQTAIQQGLSEMAVAKERDPNFDSDLERLRQLEGRYQEPLPELSRFRGRSRVTSPIQRILKQSYRNSAKIR